MSVASRRSRAPFNPLALPRPDQDQYDEDGGGSGFLGTGIGPDVGLGGVTALKELGAGVTALGRLGYQALTPAKDGPAVGDTLSLLGKGMVSSIAGTQDTINPVSLLSDVTGIERIGPVPLQAGTATKDLWGEEFEGKNFFEKAGDRGIIAAAVEDVGNAALVGSLATAPVKGAAKLSKVAGASEVASRLEAVHRGLINQPLIRAAQHPYRVTAQALRTKYLKPAAALDEAASGLSVASPIAGWSDEYMASRGLEDPGIVDRTLRVDDKTGSARAKAYEDAPAYDAAAEGNYRAFVADTEDQYRFFTEEKGFEFEFVDNDPYDVTTPEGRDALANDVAEGRFKVFKTKEGEHPFLTAEQNDKFRAVHDLVGHMELMNDFSRHGEEVAFAAHARMYSPEARPALATETRGQNSALNFSEANKARRLAGESAEFGDQKVATIEGLDDTKGLYLDPKKVAAAGDSTLNRALAKTERYLQRRETVRVSREKQRIAEATRRRSARNKDVTTAVRAAQLLVEETGIAPDRASRIIGAEMEARISGVQGLIDWAAERGIHPDEVRRITHRGEGLPAEGITPESRQAIETAITTAVEEHLRVADDIRAELFASRKGRLGLENLEDDAPLLTKGQEQRIRRAQKMLQQADELQNQVGRERGWKTARKAHAADALGRIGQKIGRVDRNILDEVEAFDHARTLAPKVWKTPEGLRRSAQRIHELTLSDGGASYLPHADRFIEVGSDPGYMVAVLPGTALKVPVEEFTPTHVEGVINAYQELFGSEDVAIGTWIEDGLVHIDPSEQVATWDEALVKGGVRQQEAIFDITSGDSYAMPLRFRPDIAEHFLRPGDRRSFGKFTRQLRKAGERSSFSEMEMVYEASHHMSRAVAAVEKGIVDKADDYFKLFDIEAAKRPSSKLGVVHQLVKKFSPDDPADQAAMLKQAQELVGDVEKSLRWYDQSHAGIERELRHLPDVTLLDGTTKINPADLAYQLLAVTSFSESPKGNLTHAMNALGTLAGPGGTKAIDRMGKVLSKVTEGKLSFDDALDQLFPDAIKSKGKKGTRARIDDLEGRTKTTQRASGDIETANLGIARQAAFTVLSGRTLDTWTPEFMVEQFKPAWGIEGFNFDPDVAIAKIDQAYPEIRERATQLAGEGWTNDRTGETTAFHVTDRGNLDSILEGGLRASATDSRGKVQVEGFKNPSDAYTYSGTTGKDRVIVEYHPSELHNENFGSVASGDVPPRGIARVTDLSGEVLFEQKVIPDAVRNQMLREFYGSKLYTKVLSFWDNLANPDRSQAVTLDMWMARLFGTTGFETQGSWAKAAEGVRKMARDLGEQLGHEVLPHQVQALLWVYVNKEISDQRVGHLLARSDEVRDAIRSGVLSLDDEIDGLTAWADESVYPYASDEYKSFDELERPVRRPGSDETTTEPMYFRKKDKAARVAQVEGGTAGDVTYVGRRNQWLEVREQINSALAKGDVDGAEGLLDEFVVKMQRELEGDLAGEANAQNFSDFLDPETMTDTQASAYARMRENLDPGRTLAQKASDEIIGEFAPKGPDTAAAIRLFETGNLATLVHEDGHFLETILTAGEKSTVERVYGIKDGTWTTAHKERFANDYMQYLSRGTAPRHLEGTFAAIKKALTDIWDGIKGSITGKKINREIADIFDSWLDPTEQPLSTPEGEIAGLTLPEVPEPGTIGQRTVRPPKYGPSRTKGDFYTAGRKSAEQRAKLQVLAKRRDTLEMTRQKIQKAHDELEDLLESGMTRAERRQAKLRERAGNTLAKVAEEQKTPSGSRTPRRWQPLYEAFGELRKVAENDPELAAALGDIPEELANIQKMALARGFNPAHVREFSPSQVRRLVSGNLRLGLGRDITEMTAGTRRNRKGTLRRLDSVEDSVESFLAASVEATLERRTNEVISHVERTVARQLPDGAEIPKGWVAWDPVRTQLLTPEPISPDTGRAVATAGPGGQVVVPEGIAKALRREGGDYGNIVFEAIGKVTSPWRTLVLTLSPGWYARNLVGNVMMAQAQGVKLTDWAAAWRSFRSKDELGRWSDIPEVGADTLAQEAGVAREAATIVPNQPGLTGLRQSIEMRPGDQRLSKLRASMSYARDRLQRANAVVDEFGRAAVIHQGLRKGLSRDEAWRAASEALVDYNNLSPFERQAVRSVVPFYSWQKGILKVMAKQVADHPGRASVMMQLGKMQEEYVADLLGVEGQDVPDYYKHLVGDRNLRSYNPFADTTDLLTPEGIARSMNPFIEVGIRKGFGAPEFWPESYRMGTFGQAEADVDVPSELVDLLGSSPAGRAAAGDSRVGAIGLHSQDLDKLRSRILRSRKQIRGIPNPEEGGQVIAVPRRG